MSKEEVKVGDKEMEVHVHVGVTKCSVVCTCVLVCVCANQHVHVHVHVCTIESCYIRIENCPLISCFNIYTCIYMYIHVYTVGSM